MLKSISTRLTTSFITLAIAPLLIVGLLFASMSYSSLKQQALADQQLKAERIGTAVSSFIREVEGELVLMGRVHGGFNVISPLEQQYILDELLTFENRFEEVAILGADGKELVRRNRNKIVTESDLANRGNDPAFTQPIASGMTYYGPVRTATENAEPVMTIAVPLFSPETGKNEGVFLGEARLKNIWELLASFAGSPGESIFLIDDQGVVVGHQNPSIALSGARFALPPNLPNFATGLDGTPAAIAVEHITLGKRSLYVVAQRPERDVLALAHSTLLMISVLLLITLGVAIFLSVLLIKNITRPLRELAAVARDIQHGEIVPMISHPRKDEVGELALAFNDMTSRLQTSLEEMKKEINERKQVELALRENRATLRQILDTTPQSIFWKDPESVYLGCNRVFAEAVGLNNPEDIKGKTDFDLPWPRKEAETYRLDDQEVIRSGRSKLHIIEHLQQADGSRLMIDTTKVPLLDGQGNISGVLGVYQDITQKVRAEEEQKKLEAQLRQSQKMEAIGTLAGGIAHDFNNILSVVFGYTELAMEMGQGESNSNQRYLKEIHKAAERARDLVKQILTFSRKTEQQQEPLQLSVIIKEALKMLRASIPTTIEIRQAISSEGMVLAEPTQIHQVIMNLCTNAYHAMKGTGGILAVSLDEVEFATGEFRYGLPPGRYMRLDVGDTGCGIDPEIRDKIFEPYFTTKQAGEGTGMGLAVVHGIIKAHNGHISVYSEVGKGTNFHIYLPMLEKSEGVASQKPAAPPNDYSGNGQRILFVDDEEQIRAVGAAILGDSGYQVTSCASGMEALQAFQKEPDHYQLIITDMTMPRMTGAEFARQAMAIRPQIPIILCTGQSTLIDREKAMALGMQDFLAKPISRQELLAAIHKALQGVGAKN